MKIPPRSCFLLKTDGIGDFILASGAIRLLAEELGETALSIAVLPLVGPLAQAEFPGAKVLVLPLRERRKVVNLFVRNFFCLLPEWLKLLMRRHHWVASFRHSRTYLHSFFLASLRTDHLAVVENQFGKDGSKRDRVESVLWKLRRDHPLPYPRYTAQWPMELEAHCRVVEQILGRRVALEEILPRWCARSAPGCDLLLAPFSSSKSKDYPLEKWAEALRIWAEGESAVLSPGVRRLLLLGAPDQQEALQAAAKLLQERLAEVGHVFSSIEVLPPAPLEHLPEVLSQAGAILTVDTVFAHLACALDRPTVVAFSGLHRGVYAPWQRSECQVWIEAEPVPDGAAPRKKSRWHEGIAPSVLARKLHGVLEKSSASRSVLSSLK